MKEDGMKILIVVVLYKTKVEDCELIPAIIQHKNLINADLYIHNNSTNYEIKKHHDYFVYNSEKNLMLAMAYNLALEFANEKGYDWLLLFDQDSKTDPKILFSEIKHNINKRYAAIIPIVKGRNGIHISPNIYNPKLGFAWGEKEIKSAGAYKNCIKSINSGSLLNVSYLNKIGGFDERFPLDGLDTLYFWKLYNANAEIFVTNAKLLQNLSVLDYSSMSIERYKKVIKAEYEVSKEMGVIPLILWLIKLPLRAAKRATQKGGLRMIIPTLFFYM